MELLVVVAIIALGLTIAGPRVQDAQIQQAQSELMRAILLLSKHARGEALAYGRAHAVYFEPGTEGGRFTVFRGVGPNCNGNDWLAIMNQGDCSQPSGTTCLMQLAANDYGLFGANFQVSRLSSYDANATPPDGAVNDQAFVYCYSAMGDMMYSLDGANFTNNSTNVGFEGGIILRITQSFVQGTTISIRGVHRRILLRMGGDIGQLT